MSCDACKHLTPAQFDRGGPCRYCGESPPGRIHELERAAETTRAEHAAALGLATARIRELEGERDELLGLLKVGEAERDLCASALYERVHTKVANRACSYSRDVKCWWHRCRAVVARIEKATP